MSDDKDRPIPVLEDVIEIGTSGDEDNPDAQADDSDTEAVYDEAFDRLFDMPEDPPQPASTAVALNAEETGTGPADEPLAGDTTEAPPASDGELEGINITAVEDLPGDSDAGGLSLSATPAESDSMWIQDWQEESATPTVVDEEHGIPVEEVDDTPATSTTPEAPTDTAGQTAEPTQTGAMDPEQITNLANEIVRQVLPEIEWKLRTRIRDVLEQELQRED